MSVMALSGDDTIILNNRVLNDLADGNVVELTFPNPIATLKIGKNGNAIYGLNNMGDTCDVKVRVVRGSSDDNFLNNLLSNQQQNFSGTVLITGQFIKKIGDGAGAITSDTYVLAGGVFEKQVEAQSNVEGDATQSVAVYMLKFSSSPRVLT